MVSTVITNQLDDSRFFFRESAGQYSCYIKSDSCVDISNLKRVCVLDYSQFQMEVSVATYEKIIGKYCIQPESCSINLI